MRQEYSKYANCVHAAAAFERQAAFCLLCSALQCWDSRGTVAGLAHLFPNASKELKQEEISTNPYEPCPEQ